VKCSKKEKERKEVLSILHVVSDQGEKTQRSSTIIYLVIRTRTRKRKKKRQQKPAEKRKKKGVNREICFFHIIVYAKIRTGRRRDDTCPFPTSREKGERQGRRTKPLQSDYSSGGIWHRAIPKKGEASRIYFPGAPQRERKTYLCSSFCRGQSREEKKGWPWIPAR